LGSWVGIECMCVSRFPLCWHKRFTNCAA
jgi:hypothetical protein